MKGLKTIALLYFVVAFLYYIAAILHFGNNNSMGVVYLGIGSAYLCLGFVENKEDK